MISPERSGRRRWPRPARPGPKVAVYGLPQKGVWDYQGSVNQQIDANTIIVRIRWKFSRYAVSSSFKFIKAFKDAEGYWVYTGKTEAVK